MELVLNRSPPLVLVLLLVVMLVDTADTISREARQDDDCAPLPQELHTCYNDVGLRQSPVYIDTCRAGSSIRRPLRFTNLDVLPRSLLTANIGAGVAGLFTYAAGRKPIISGGGLLQEYSLEYFDLHWGTNSSSGSEHVVDGRRYAGELYLGFTNVKYLTSVEAMQNIDGGVVVSVFLDEDVRTPGRGITGLAPALLEIKAALSSHDLMSPPSIRELLPDNLRRYVQYDGSGTNYACIEALTYIVFLTPIRILPVELELLRDLRSLSGKRLCRSMNRQLQPLSGRRLYRSGPTPGCSIPWPS